MGWLMGILPDQVRLRLAKGPSTQHEIRVGGPPAASSLQTAPLSPGKLCVK